MDRRRGWLYIGVGLAVGCGRMGYELGEAAGDAAFAADATAAADTASAGDAAPTTDARPDTADAACLERGRPLLINGGFEEPVIGDGSGTFTFLQASQVPGWQSTDPDGWMELWESGHREIESAGGVQHVELNVHTPTAVYQDAATTPGSVLSWELHHRGRDGRDTIKVAFGAPDGPLEEQDSLKAKLVWRRHEGLYVVPAGQDVTRFEFRAVAPESSVGNFLDEVGVFELECPTE